MISKYFEMALAVTALLLLKKMMPQDS